MIEYEEEIQEVSQNEVPVEENENNNDEILEELRGLRSDVQDLSDVIISLGVSDNDVVDNQIVSVNSVSQNIIDTPIKDYTLTEQIIVLELAIGLFIGLIYIIKRSVFKWH